MYKNKIFLLSFLSLVSIQCVVSQSSTNSPYTRFGFGDISDTNSGEQRAMGGVALGARSNTNINTVNPASYSAVDSMTFMFDLGVSALLSNYTSTLGNNQKFTSNLDYITLQIPIVKNVGFSAGLLPYSHVGYNYKKDQEHSTGLSLADFSTLSYRTSFSGEGGFSQVYTGISAKFLDHISVGANAYYMFGTVNNMRSIRVLSSSDSTTQYNSITANSFRFRYGIQLYNTFAKKHDVTLGLIYEQKKRLNGHFAQLTSGTLYEISSPSANDSIFELPEMYGVGLYYTYNKKLSIALDYTLSKWGEAKYRNAYTDLSNRSKIAFGVQYLPDARGRKFSDRMSYRAGFNLSDPYYKVNAAVPPKNFGFSVGLGLPLYNSVTNTVTMLNTTLEYGKIGSSDVLREDYMKFTLNITFNEHWFFKRKL